MFGWLVTPTSTSNAPTMRVARRSCCGAPPRPQASSKGMSRHCTSLIALDFWPICDKLSFLGGDPMLIVIAGVTPQAGASFRRAGAAPKTKDETHGQRKIAERPGRIFEQHSQEQDAGDSVLG